MYEEFTKDLTVLCQKYNMELLSAPQVKQASPLEPSEDVFNSRVNAYNPNVSDSTMMEVKFTCVKHFVWDDNYGNI
jgi:hypothetical protein